MLRKREREDPIPSTEPPRRPAQPQIYEPLEDPHLFELRNILLLLKESPPSEVQQQLLSFLSKTKPSPITQGLILDFLKKREVIIKPLLAKLSLNVGDFEWLMTAAQPEWLGQLLINQLRRKPTSDDSFCQLIRKLLLHPNSSLQSTMTPSFIQMLIHLYKHDPNKKELIHVTSSHLLKYFSSRQLLITNMFRELLKIPEFHPSLKLFIQHLIKHNLELQPTFEHYIISHLLKITNTLKGFKADELFEYLCHKMKSLDRDTRKSSIQAIQSFPINSRMVSQMIEKDTLDRTVIHRRGILLQMLEDEFQDIRMSAIECLKSFSLYMNVSEVKQILLYMINDESDRVRAEALKALVVVAKNYVVNREDLEIILMPLKESSRTLRYFCYKVIEILSIPTQELFVSFIQRLLRAYRNYKEDKAFLYKVMQRLGQTYSSFVINNIKVLLDVQHLEGIQEPSWKNFTHKARVILVANSFAPDYAKNIQLNKAKLPFFFQNHYEYIKDVEEYAFEEEKAPIEILPLLVGASTVEISSMIRTIRAHMVFWEELPINKFTTRQRFLRSIFQIAESVYNVEKTLEASTCEGIYFSEKVLGIMRVAADTIERFEEWELEHFDLATLLMFQYYVLTRLNPLYFDKSEVSSLTILNSKLLNSFKCSNTPPPVIAELEECNKQIMTTLTHPSQHIKNLRCILLRHPVFSLLLRQLATLTSMKIEEPTFEIDCEMLNSHSKEYLIQCDIANSKRNISMFKLKVETSFNTQVIQILESDCKESELGEDHKRVYSLKVHSHQFEGTVKRIRAVKLSRYFRFTDAEEEQTICRLLGFETPTIALDLKEL